MFKSDSLSTQSLASCELLLWNFQSVPKHCKKVPLQVFDIVQFSRSCARQPSDRRPAYFTTAPPACQALFSKCSQVFRGFVGRSGERSDIILHPVPFVNPLFAFSVTFCLGGPAFSILHRKRAAYTSKRTDGPFGISYRISMFSLYFRLPRIFLTARSTCSGSSSALGSASTREKAMLFFPSPRFLPR